MNVELRRIRVCAVEEIPPEEGRVVRIADRPIAMFRSGTAVYALDNTCTHRGGPLADGLVSDATVACPLHDRRFELASGRAVGHDCGAVAAYPVEIVDGDVMLTVPVFRGPGVTLGTFTGTDTDTDTDATQAPAESSPPSSSEAPEESYLEREVEANAGLVGEPPAA